MRLNLGRALIYPGDGGGFRAVAVCCSMEIVLHSSIYSGLLIEFSSLKPCFLLIILFFKPTFLCVLMIVSLPWEKNCVKFSF